MEENSILKLSVSAIKTYEDCPRKYYYQYIEKRPKKSWEHQELGNFVHGVLEDFHNVLLTTPTEDLPGLMSRSAKERLKQFKLSPDSRTAASNMLKQYLAMLNVSGLPPVVANEQRFSVAIDESTILRGVIDRVDEVVTTVPDDMGRAVQQYKYKLVDYKGLAVDTPIPTPTGWTTMGELKVGDYVFGSDGKPTRVTVKSEIHNRPCYKITLSDHSTVVCDNVHLWNILHNSSHATSTVDTELLYLLFKAYTSTPSLNGRLAIKNANSLELPSRVLPEYSGSEYFPEEYLRASHEQRASLLNRIMRKYGKYYKRRATLALTSESFCNSVCELLRTLGVSARSHVVTKLTTKQFKIIFNRSAMSCVAVNSRVKQIKNVEQVKSVPTQCIAVEAQDSLYLCGKGFIVTHNTGKSKYLSPFQLQAYGLHLLDKNPSITEFSASYLVLSEGMKDVPYSFTVKDIGDAKSKISEVASCIREEKAWQTKPTFLCNYCDFADVCPDKFKGRGKTKGSGNGSDLVKIGRVGF